jgi:Cu/Ag efflux pump CusA
LSGSGKAIIIRLYGPELDVLRKKADEIKDKISHVKGLVNLHVERQQKIPQIKIEVNLNKAKKYGVKPGEVRRIISTFVSGIEVSDIHQDGKVYEVMV